MHSILAAKVRKKGEIQQSYLCFLRSNHIVSSCIIIDLSYGCSNSPGFYEMNGCKLSNMFSANNCKEVMEDCIIAWNLPKSRNPTKADVSEPTGALAILPNYTP